MKNKNLLILMLVMLINAIGYGTIIPLMYPYGARFGLHATGMSLLVASFSLAQFLATPILGRLSDKYGRKIILSLCLLGSSASFFLFAGAQNVLMLFIARILDGITGGNISVAQAAIADETPVKDRAKAFGMLGAAFGFGFVFGPALGGFFSKINISTPFVFSGILSLIAGVLCIFVLRETNINRDKKVALSNLFNPRSLVHALSTPIVGVILIVSFISLIAQNAMIIGFQAYTNDILKLDPAGIALLFSSYGVVNIIMQAVGVKILIDKIRDKKKIAFLSLVLGALIMFLVSISTGYYPFFIFMLLYGVALSPIGIVLTSLISERTRAEDQGGIMGINQAYTSLSQIFGPLIAGSIAVYSVKFIFFFVAAVLIFSALISRRIEISHEKLDL